jgi:DNA-binding NtrC family response regulator
MKTSNTLKIFIVDDDKLSLTMYEKHLHNLGYSNVFLFENCKACLNNLTRQPDIIFLDHNMEILNGVEMLKKIKHFNPNVYVVFISGQDDVQTAVNSLKYGAFDYIIKGNNDTGRISQVLDKIYELRELLQMRSNFFFKNIFPSIE